MSDHELDARLNALAERASHAIPPRPVDDVRRRGDTRRRRHQATTAGLGVVAAAVIALVVVPPLGGKQPPPATPSMPVTSSAPASLSPVKVTGDVIAGVVVAPASDRGKALAQLPDGTVGVSADAGQRLFFDLHRTTGRGYTLREAATGKCLAEYQPGPTAPFKLRLADCAPQTQAQQFRFEDAASDKLPGYYLTDTTGGFVFDSADGVIVQEVPDGGADTWQAMR